MASEIKVDTVSEKTSGSGVTIDGLLIKDGGISGDVSLIGTTPTFTIGDAGAEDATLLFDGNAQDFYIALDDSADDLVIGKGSAVGTTPAVSIDENLQVIVHDNLSLLSDSSVLKFGTDGDTTLTHTDGTGLTLNSTNKICFNDASQFIQGSSNAILALGATDEIDLTATAVDLNGTLDVSGNSQFSGTITVGVDDTGKDVKLFGATSGSYLEWDESADDLNLIASGIGVTTAKDLGTGIHIRTADSGASVNANCDELVIEGSGNSGLTILSGASSEGLIFFGDSGSNAIGRLEYNHSTNAMAMTTGGNTAMIIDGNGHITKPLQPVFLVTKSGHQNDIAINATTTITFDTERIDINADFASNTFTAPVTGSYQFNFTITWGAYDTDFGYQYTMFVASNRTVYAHLGSGNQITADGYYNSGGSCVIDMDANDTCILKVQFSNDGAAQADASQSSYFSGFLIG